MIKIVLMFAMLIPAAKLDGTMQRAEKMTPQEIKELTEVNAEVDTAIAHQTLIKAKIAAQHSMGASSWMEYSTWYQFDGEYIVQRYQSYQKTQNFLPK